MANGFRAEDFQKSTNQKQELIMADMLINESGQNISSLYKSTFHRFRFIWPGEFKCEKFTDDGRQMKAKAHIAFRPGELKWYKFQ